MRTRFVLFLLLVFALSAAYFSWRSRVITVVPAPNELNAAEAEAIRLAITTEGPTDASPSWERPYPRILIVPKEVEARYAAKPDATVMLLLKIVEEGKPLASIHASACIHALVWGPEFGWMATQVDPKTWDEPIGEGRETNRRFDYDVCVRLIAEKKQEGADKGKD
jgi:hypothetical protein